MQPPSSHVPAAPSPAPTLPEVGWAVRAPQGLADRRRQWHDDPRNALGDNVERRRQDRNLVLQRIAAGDLAAVQHCMNQYGGMILGLARRWTHGLTDAEDAVQEIFLDLWSSAGRFDPERSSEAAFVVMIARRRLIDIRRKHRSSPASASVTTDALEGLSAEAVSPDRGSEARQIEKAVSLLKPEPRRILLMAICEGLTHEQIASATGLPLGTVKSHARRALLKVREILAEEAVSQPAEPAPEKST